MTPRLALVAVGLLLPLSACGSGDGAPGAASAASSAATSGVEYFPSEGLPAPSGPCGAAPATSGGTPAWTLPGATGSLVVTAPTADAAPRVEVTPPFSVTETLVQVLAPSEGAVVAPTATVSVCYQGVNGRDGATFDSTYRTGRPAEFPLDGVVPGFSKAIAGQRVGSTVAVAMTSADGYPDGQPAAGIDAGDSLIFTIAILDAR